MRNHTETVAAIAGSEVKSLVRIDDHRRAVEHFEFMALSDDKDIGSFYVFNGDINDRLLVETIKETIIRDLERVARRGDRVLVNSRFLLKTASDNPLSVTRTIGAKATARKSYIK